MKIYVPTPTEAGRVQEYEVSQDGKFLKGYHEGYFVSFWAPNENKKWFFSEAAARAASEALTRRRIASLEKQITKLKGFLGEAPNA